MTSDGLGRGRAFLCSAVAGAAAACGSAGHVDLRPGAAPADIQALEARSRAGDKQAQLELGRRFEEGRGVTVDRGRARALYRAAAATAGGTRMLFVAGSNGAVSAVPASSGPQVAGLPEAYRRLVSLEARGADADDPVIVVARVIVATPIADAPICSNPPSPRCEAYRLTLRPGRLGDAVLLAVDRYDDNGDRMSDWAQEAVLFSGEERSRLTFDRLATGEYVLRTAKLEK